MDDVNDRKIKKLRNQAISYGLKRGLSFEEAEDMAQIFLLKQCIKKTRQRFDQCFIDFIRKKLGDSRCQYKKEGSPQLDLTFNANDPLLPDEIIIKKEHTKNILKLLNTRQKKVIFYILKYRGQEFAARKLGVTSNRINQILREIREIIKSHDATLPFS